MILEDFSFDLIKFDASITFCTLFKTKNLLYKDYNILDYNIIIFCLYIHGNNYLDFKVNSFSMYIFDYYYSHAIALTRSQII